VTPALRRQIDAGEAKPRPAKSSALAPALDVFIAGPADLDADQLRLQWRNHLGGTPPAHLPRWLLARVLGQRMQVATLGDLDRATLRMIRQAKGGDGSDIRVFAPRDPATRDGVGLKAGALLVREWNGAPQRVMCWRRASPGTTMPAAALAALQDARYDERGRRTTQGGASQSPLRHALFLSSRVAGACRTRGGSKADCPTGFGTRAWNSDRRPPSRPWLHLRSVPRFGSNSMRAVG
jgi:Protein of unknown function (DUF2924)